MRLFASLILSAILTLPACAQGNAESSPEFRQCLRGVEACLREDPENISDLVKRLTGLKLLALNEPERAQFDDIRQAVERRTDDVGAIYFAIAEAAVAHEELASGGTIDAVSKRMSAALRKIHNVEWVGHRQEEWHKGALAVVRDLRQRATDATGDPAKADWIAAGKSLQLAASIASSLPPEVFPPQDAMNLIREADAGVEKMYFDTDFAAALPWEDMMAEKVDWKRDDDVKVSKKDREWALENSGTQPCLFWLNRQVEWQDYTVRIEVTVENEAGFQILQRQSGESPAAASQDVTALLQSHAVNLGERATLQFIVYGNKFRTSVGDKQGRPCRCAPTGSRSGGFSFRFPPGAKIVIHKLEVKVLRADE